MGNDVFENHYDYFLAKNERLMNGVFGKILWYCCLVGPAIAVGVFFRAFPEVTYFACLQTFLVVLAFALGHTVLYKFKPESHFIKFIGLFGILITVYTMCINKIGIYLTYFSVPLISLLYCSRRTYVFMSVLTYLMLVVSNWQISEYAAGLRPDIERLPWFIGRVGGETIEFFVMFGCGMFLNKIMTKHLQTMYVGEVSLNKTEREAFSDLLTGLWNRRYLDRAFDKYAVVQRNAGAFLVADLDHLKLVNDTYGHLEGDRAIRLFADVLRKSFEKSPWATICRFGGDEFVVLLPHVQTVSDLTLCISQLIANSDETFCNDENLNLVAVSVGAAFINESDMNYQSVFERADKALYEVKKNGRNSFQIYTEK